MTVLIMDDAVLVRKLIADLLSELEDIGSILEAGDANSAVELFSKYKPEIVILDIKVPGGGGLKNGIDVLRTVKKAYQTHVIMLTNHANPKYLSECKQAGADFFFDKSTEFDKVPDAVLEIVQRTTSLH
ncbi:MAG: response regulator transcription factor [Caldilineaceae bacterium]